MQGMNLPRIGLAQLPTPLERMIRLGAFCGLNELWVKRDDLSGLAFGGNKVRKLELLVAQALEQGADTLITRGAAQSNHCRQTAAAAAKLGLKCILVLRGRDSEPVQGNLLLDRLLGAQVVWTQGRDPETVLAEACLEQEKAGRRPYRIPYGGSSGVGAAGYAIAFDELMQQDAGFHTIVVASSSGGTQAGLVAGARMSGWNGRILGISIEPPASELRQMVAGFAQEVLRGSGRTEWIEPEAIEVLDQYRGQGYGILGDLEVEALQVFAKTEGLLLDPVYTARAAGGMLDQIRQGRIDSRERVLFWHTGGGPGLFAYASGLVGGTSTRNAPGLER